MKLEFATISFMAESGHGKNFCGDWVQKHFGYASAAFADHIKRLCRAVFKEFTSEILWGDADLRNQEVTVDWDTAQNRLTWSVDDWVNWLGNLSIEEKANYKTVVESWLKDLRYRLNDGKVSPRIALQLLGTEYGRNFKKDIWSSYLLTQVVPEIKDGSNYIPEVGLIELMDGGARVGPPSGVVITDCRFENELAEVQKHGGYVIKVVRKALKGKDNAAENAGIKNHVSEAEMRGIPDEAFDLILEMDDGPENVYPRLQQMMEFREFEVARQKHGKKPWAPPIHG